MNKYRWILWLMVWATTGTPFCILQAEDILLEGKPHPPPTSFPYRNVSFKELNQRVTDMKKAGNWAGIMELWRQLDPEKQPRSILNQRLIRVFLGVDNGLSRPRIHDQVKVHPDHIGWYLELLLSQPLTDGVYISVHYERYQYEKAIEAEGAAEVLVNLIQSDAEWTQEQERLLLGLAAGAFTEQQMWKEIAKLEPRIKKAGIDESKRFPRLQVYPQLGVALIQEGDKERGMAVFMKGLDAYFYHPGRELDILMTDPGFSEALYRRLKESRHEMRIEALNNPRIHRPRTGRPEVHIESILTQMMGSQDLAHGVRVVESGLFDLYPVEKQADFVRSYLPNTLSLEERQKRIWLLEDMEKKHPDRAATWLGIRLNWYRQEEPFSEERFRKQLEVALSRPSALSVEWIDTIRKETKNRDLQREVLFPFWEELLSHPDLQEQVRVHVWQQYITYLKWVRKKGWTEQQMREVIYPALRENRIPLSALGALHNFLRRDKKLEGFVQELLAFPEEQVHADVFLAMGNMIAKKQPNRMDLIRRAYDVHPTHEQIRAKLIAMLKAQNLNDEILEITRASHALNEDKVETLPQLLILMETGQINNWARWQEMSRQGQTLKGFPISEEVFRVLAQKEKWKQAEAFFTDGLRTARVPWKGQRTECGYLLLGAEMYLHLNNPQAWGTLFFQALDRKMITASEFQVMDRQLAMSREHWAEEIETQITDWPSKLQKRGAWTIRHKHLFSEQNPAPAKKEGAAL